MSKIYFYDSPIPQNYNGYVDADTAIKLGIKSPKSDCNRVVGFHLATSRWVIDYSKFPIRKRRYSSREELENAVKASMTEKLTGECNHHYVKNGKNKHGDQKYICSKCRSVFTDSDRKVGRPCLFEVPLTGAEKTERSRIKKKSL